MSSPHEYVGYSGTGSFTQSGGSNAGANSSNPLSLTLGNNSGSVGTYALSSTGQLTATAETIGYNGTGTFTQSGGTNTTSLSLGVLAGSSGTYNLRGGLLVAKAIGAGGGTATLNLSGGTLQASTGFSSNVSMTLSAASTPTIDPLGYAVTLSSSIAGGGGFTKISSGTLDLTGSNTYSGTTTISAGVLEAKTTGSLPGYNTTGKVSVAGIATLAVNVGGSGEWNSTTTDNIAALLGHATFNSGSALGIDTTDATTAFTYTGNITNASVGLTKLGPNTLTLAGNSTYPGATTISGGTLAVNGSLLSSGTVSVAGSTTLSGTGSVGNVIVGSSGVVAPGLLGSGTLTMTTLTLGASDTLGYTLGTLTGSDGLLTITSANGMTLDSSVKLTLSVTSGGALVTGTYPLLSVPNGTITDTNGGTSFSGWTIAGIYYPGTTFSLANNGGEIDLSVTAPTFAGTWTGTTGGSWNTAANWQYRSIPATVASSTTDSATFGTTIGSTTATVTMGGPHTLTP